MSSVFSSGKDRFGYVNKGSFIMITTYEYENGVLVFEEEDDGKSYFHIHIPEMIDGLPVLVVDKLWLNVKYGQNYRHNGYDVVKIHIPENTAFLGLKQVRKDSYSVFVPNFSEVYYPRESKLFFETVGEYRFFAEKINETDCRIITVMSDNFLKKDWVWSKNTPKEKPSLENLTVPSYIGDYRVVEIASDSTLSLTKTVKKIVIKEGIESIGKKCFSQLPYISSVFLPQSIKTIGEEAFGYYKCSRYVEDIPTLYVYYHNMPQLGVGAFVRCAEKEEYEDYADWGDMYVGSTKLSYKVIFKKHE